jgi:hypothetical protein
MAILLPPVHPLWAQHMTAQVKEQAVQSMKQVWDCSDQSNSKAATFHFYINGYQEAVCPLLKDSSGNKQFDAECAEAVISHRPLREQLSNVSYTKGLRETEIVFGFSSKFSGEDIRKFSQSHKTMSENKVIVHVVPLSVMQLFPGLFKQEELLTESNLREIDATEIDVKAVRSTGYLLELTKMYAGLGKLYDKKNLRKEDVLNALKNPE